MPGEFEKRSFVLLRPNEIEEAILVMEGNDGSEHPMVVTPKRAGHGRHEKSGALLDEKPLRCVDCGKLLCDDCAQGNLTSNAMWCPECFEKAKKDKQEVDTMEKSEQKRASYSEEIYDEKSAVKKMIEPNVYQEPGEALIITHNVAGPCPFCRTFKSEPLFEEMGQMVYYCWNCAQRWSGKAKLLPRSVVGANIPGKPIGEQSVMGR